MRTRQPFLSRTLLATAVAVTLLFAASVPFSFGGSTHRAAADWSWNCSASGFGLAQVYCGWGQFHLTVDLARPTGYGGGKGLEPRRWYAGAIWNPHLSPDLRETDRLISKLGFDGFINHGTYVGVGVFGPYPVAAAWLLWWIARASRRPVAGRCPVCRYDLRSSPDRCPECGTPTAAVSADRTFERRPT